MRIERERGEIGRESRQERSIEGLREREGERAGRERERERGERDDDEKERE